MGYEVMRWPMSSQGTALFYSLLDLSRPWVSLDRIYEEKLDVGWLTSIGYGGGEGLVTPKDRLQSQLISGPCSDAKARFLSFNSTQSRAVTGLITGHNTLRRHLHLIGLTVHCVGGVE
jgi:hypothetical protein